MPSRSNTCQKWCIVLLCAVSLSTIIIASTSVHQDFILGAGGIGGLAAALIVISCVSLFVTLVTWFVMGGDRQIVEDRFFWVFWLFWGGAAGWATGLWAAAYHLVGLHPSGCDDLSRATCADNYAAAAAQLAIPSWFGFALVTFFLLGGCCGTRPPIILPTHAPMETANPDSKDKFP